MKIPTHYMTFKDHGAIGIGSSDPLSWDDACDDLADAIAEGQDCVVYLMDPPEGRSCGMIVDVSEKAAEQVREWNKNRHHDAPEEISDPTDTRYDEMREARAMEASQ